MANYGAAVVVLAIALVIALGSGKLTAKTEVQAVAINTDGKSCAQVCNDQGYPSGTESSCTGNGITYGPCCCEPICKDTDIADDLFVKGVCKDAKGTYEDKCSFSVGGNSVDQYSCVNNNCQFESEKCTTLQSCVEGVCL